MAQPPAVPVRAYVRLTVPAFADLEALLEKDARVVRWALKKMLLLERDPEAGAPLLGQLIGWRKLNAADRDWRVVWRVSFDDAGAVIVTIAEIWAIGARSDAEVYTEMNERIASAAQHPTTLALAEVIKMLGRHAQRDDLQPAVQPPNDPVPDWLRERLIHTAGLTAATVDKMSGAQAMERWETFMTTGT